MATDEPTRDRILDAAVEAAALHGIRRLSVADVAKRAQLSRPTLYKHFESKDALIAAAVGREVTGLLAAVLAAAEAHDDPRDALEAATYETLRLAREHPLLDRIVRTEPDVLVPFLTTDGGPVISLVRATTDGVLATRLPDVDEVQRRRLADIVTRLMISYAISAPDDPPEVVAAAIADFLVLGAASIAPSTFTPDAEARR